MQIDRHSTEL